MGCGAQGNEIDQSFVGGAGGGAPAGAGAAAAAAASEAGAAALPLPVYRTRDLAGVVALVTGASSGIGEATAIRLAQAGARVVLCARRADRLAALAARLRFALPGAELLELQLDVTDTGAVMALPKRIEGTPFEKVDILVANAGLALGVASADANDMTDAKRMIDTNVLGVISLCSAFLPGLRARNSGHLVITGSIAGHVAYAGGSCYNASKFAMTGFSQATRHDLKGTAIRVTQVSPGAVETEFSNVRFNGNDAKVDSVYAGFTPLNGEDIADNIMYAVTRPVHHQVADMVVFANAQSGPTDIARNSAAP